MELYKNNRIKGSMHYQPWKNQIIEGKYNFSYGSRIHGNIIALQNNIPAFVKVHDSRTREIAEFYDIPNCMNIKFDEKCDSLYDLYSELDYTNFNKTYQKRYSDFKNFLDKEQIPNLLGNNSNYLNYLASLNYCIQDTNLVEQKKIQFIRHAQWKMLQNKLLKKEKIGNKRIIHILGIKISYKKR